MSVVTLDSIYKKVLSQGNKEQNSMYPPHIFDEHFNIVTNFILDEVVKAFANNRSIVDLASPFLMTREVAVISGEVEFPPNYRNLLGVAMYVTIKGDEDCGCKDCGCHEEKRDFQNDPLAKSAKQVMKTIERNKCTSRDLIELDIDEFSDRSTHPYKKPTLKKPVFCQFKSKKIKVCPFDISHVELRYIREPKVYRYGYVEQPDHTFVPDLASTVESEWEHTALQPLVKGMTALYSVYTKDGELQNWNEVIKKAGLF